MLLFTLMMRLHTERPHQLGLMSPAGCTGRGTRTAPGRWSGRRVLTARWPQCPTTQWSTASLTQTAAKDLRSQGGRVRVFDAPACRAAGPEALPGAHVMWEWLGRHGLHAAYTEAKSRIL